VQVPQPRLPLQPLLAREKLIRISSKSLPVAPQPDAAGKASIVQKPAMQGKV
jgi:hypothetical protein